MDHKPTLIGITKEDHEHNCHHMTKTFAHEVATWKKEIEQEIKECEAVMAEYKDEQESKRYNYAKGKRDGFITVIKSRPKSERWHHQRDILLPTIILESEKINYAHTICIHAIIRNPN